MTLCRRNTTWALRREKKNSQYKYHAAVCSRHWAAEESTAENALSSSRADSRRTVHFCVPGPGYPHSRALVVGPGYTKEGKDYF